MESKVQSALLSLPANSPAGRRDFKVTLDSEFDHSTGLYAIENHNGGLVTPWKIGLKDSTRTYLDLVNGKHLQASTNYKIKDRFYPQWMRAKGRNIFVTIETYEATTSELNIDLFFELVKGEMNDPNCPPKVQPAQAVQPVVAK